VLSGPGGGGKGGELSTGGGGELSTGGGSALSGGGVTVESPGKSVVSGGASDKTRCSPLEQPDTVMENNTIDVPHSRSAARYADPSLLTSRLVRMKTQPLS
jgi:hypothetical protein